MAKLIYALMLCAVCATAQIVEGTVIDSITGNGIPGAKVEIVQAPNPVRAERFEILQALDGMSAYSVTADLQGRFRIEDVRDGVYLFVASAPKYFDADVLDPVARLAARRFQVTAGRTPVKLQSRLIPIGRLTGRVIDGRGEAIPKVGVHLEMGAIAVSLLRTDANGKFQHGLIPGTVQTLSVGPPLGWKLPDPEPDSGRVLGWARTYYPGVADPEAAAKIIARTGAEVLDIEMKLLAVPAHAVRGVLLNPDGTPASKLSITLGENRMSPVYRAESKAGGSFEFPAVVDGEWRLSAETESGGVKLQVVEWMRMAGRDMEGVRLRLSAPFTVRGRVVMETPKGRQAPAVPSVSLVPMGPVRLVTSESALDARADADGNFNVQNIYPSAYRFRAPEQPPQGYYLDAVMLGEAEAPAPEFMLFPGAPSISLIFKTNGGSVRGTVEKCALGGVALVPQNPALRWPAAIRSARCDANDRYEIASLRPGEYYAQALPLDTSAILWNPEFDERFLNQASRLTVRAGETTSADLRLIPSR